MKNALTALLIAAAVLGGTAPPVQAAEPVTEPTEAENVEPEGPPAQANGQIEALNRGTRAPWTGMLIEQRDLVRWRLEIDHLRFRLDRDVRLEQDKCAVSLKLSTRMLELEKDHAEKVDALWKIRAEALGSSNVDLQKAVAKAQERGFFDEPVVWYVGGILTTGLIAGLVAYTAR
jgi:hypothetical protein